jgi:hypothetical protein
VPRPQRQGIETLTGTVVLVNPSHNDVNAETVMFIIYNVETTRISRPKWYHKGYKSRGAAKAAMTRSKLSSPEYAIEDSAVFFATIEKKVTKHNPSTETYHSM